jgi:hypothetical protein
MAVTAPPTRPAGAAASVAPGRRTVASRAGDLLADPRRVLLVAALVAAFAACVDVLHDPDLFWHLRLGQWILDTHTVPHAELFSFSAAGNGMTAHEWGSEVVFALLDRVGGLLTVSVVMALVAWSALVALALRARARGAGVVAVAVAVLLGARAAEPVLGTRPQVITVALVCWTLWVAERHLARGGRWVWVLPPVVLLSANLHGGVVLGLGALGVLVVLEALRCVLRRPGCAPWGRVRSLAGVVGLAVLVGCVNPNGPGLYRYALTTSERLKPITEWHSPDFTDPSNVGLLVLLVSFALLVALGGRLSLRDAGLAVAGFAAALLAVRNTSLAVALALPGWAAMLQQVITRVSARRASGPDDPGKSPARRADGAGFSAAPEIREKSPARRDAARSDSPRRLGAPQAVAATAIISLAAAVSTVSVARAATDASPQGIATTYPACAANTLHGISDVRIVAPYYHSGYLILQLWPQGRVFLYGESASLGTAVFDDYLRIYAGTTQSLTLLEQHSTNAVLAPPGPLHDRLANSPSWQKALDDPMGLTLYTTPQLAAQLPPPHC